MRPRIGLTTSPGTHDDRLVEMLDRAYVAAIVAAGAVPLILPVLDPAEADEVVSGLDGIVLTGGGDVDPLWYCAPPSPHLHQVDAQRDAWELALAGAAEGRGLPVLGICRGAQVLNVAMGGTLLQHLPELTELRHCDKERWGAPVHGVQVREASTLFEIVGNGELGVNSLHHQAVREVAPGLAAVAWADDGIIEAVEGADGSPVLGVQWHPELLVDEAGHPEVFQWLVREADDRRKQAIPVPTSAMTGAPIG